MDEKKEIGVGGESRLTCVIDVCLLDEMLEEVRKRSHAGIDEGVGTHELSVTQGQTVAAAYIALEMCARILKAQDGHFGVQDGLDVGEFTAEEWKDTTEKTRLLALVTGHCGSCDGHVEVTGRHAKVVSGGAKGGHAQLEMEGESVRVRMIVLLWV